MADMPVDMNGNSGSTCPMPPYPCDPCYAAYRAGYNAGFTDGFNVCTAQQQCNQGSNCCCKNQSC